MRVGLLGGSFNPAHEGHAHVAETARVRLGLDRVIWLVSPLNPFKKASDTAPLAERMSSARRWARGPSMIVSDFETRIGARYTLDTLRLLKARFPGVRFVWLMGSDNLAQFHRWRGWTQIMQTAPVAVISRPTGLSSNRFTPAARRFARSRLSSREALALPGRGAPAWLYLRGPLHPASSTAIRAARKLDPLTRPPQA